jgi:hypothetical protein
MNGGLSMNAGLFRVTVGVLLGLSVSSCSGQTTAGSDSNTVQKVGNIYVEPPAMPGGPATPGIMAVFAEAAGPATPVPQSTLLKVDAGTGSCTVSQSTTPTGGTPSLPSVTPASAGTITMVGSQQSLVLVPQLRSLGDRGSSLIYTAPPGAMGFLPGHSLTITASGATVPAFSVSITVPTAITVTQPDLKVLGCSSTGCPPPLTISRTLDFPITWTGGGPAGDVHFEFVQIVGGTNMVIDCSAPSSAGHSVIPVSALSYLTPTSAGVSFGVNSVSLELLTVQDWTIRLVAEPPDFVETEVTVE